MAVAKQLYIPRISRHVPTSPPYEITTSAPRAWGVALSSALVRRGIAGLLLLLLLLLDPRRPPPTPLLSGARLEARRERGAVRRGAASAACALGRRARRGLDRLLLLLSVSSFSTPTLSSHSPPPSDSAREARGAGAKGADLVVWRGEVQPDLLEVLRREKEVAVDLVKVLRREHRVAIVVVVAVAVVVIDVKGPRSRR